ncbi:unnamed protein product [Rhizoctonia solani]|uniref:Laminin domain protein n=1 Tax=Rhizoctonia solani TaxID=456999 RepID=A0A8H2X5K6_9AGAM|nr:unnamed protein product [Rhizoctonia solani]
MVDHPGWYPPGQICYPPVLPENFKNVHDLRPIVGVPSDEEVIGIHAVMHAANRVSGVPGMHDPGFFMKLADHLFNAQMGIEAGTHLLHFRVKDAIYTPPTLPSHIPVDLKAVSGAPSDDEMTKVQDAIQTYQELRRIPSMFDAHINMELSQHLFDLQMARHMRIAGESLPSLAAQTTAGLESHDRIAEPARNTAQELVTATNNAGTGGNAAGAHLDQTLQPVPSIVHEMVEQSSQLTERFNQVLERLTQLAERSHQPTERSDRLTERFNLLFERFNQLVEQSNQPAHRANELAERSNELADRLMEQLNKPVEKIGDLLKNINGVLVGIQHAIVRNHKANTLNAVESLVNEKGETLIGMHKKFQNDVKYFLELYKDETDDRVPIVIDSGWHHYCVPNEWLGDFLHLYGIGDGLCIDATSTILLPHKETEARRRLQDYFSACLG